MPQAYVFGGMSAQLMNFPCMVANISVIYTQLQAI